MRLPIRARGIGAIVPLAAVLLAAQPASAHVAATSGSPGNFVVTDTEASPGAHCFYYYRDNGNMTDMYKIKIRAPKMYARNRTGNVDSQKVGWQFSIQNGTTVGSAPDAWKTYYKSPIVKATAYDNQAAAFTVRTWLAPKAFNRWWRVKLLMFWYQPGSSTTISGQVNDVIDWYTWTYPPAGDSVYPTDCIPDE